MYIYYISAFLIANHHRPQIFKLVAIFYAAIILIVVGSNCHRFRKHHSSSDRGVRRAAKHLLTFADNKLNIFHIVLKRHRSPNSSNPQIAIV
ncbi:uncharacterized protein CDAR_554561 [Caerostris darwini]|uniref:Uncharacterized protein n=1 Tax=Caerostris darwini TaxID=1538125 RepID=A0AAV4T952_9ARAC|nr:uncharacterized protein CDAR_554561 [Caerostris darwini]